MPSALCCCWLGGTKGIWPVKTDWWGAGMVICLERDADLHIAQLRYDTIRDAILTCVESRHVSLIYRMEPTTKKV